MSDSSDDEPLSLKRQKLDASTGGVSQPSQKEGRDAARQKVNYAESSSDEEDSIPLAAKKPVKSAKREAVLPKKAENLEKSSSKVEKGADKATAKPKKEADTKANGTVVKREKKVYDMPGQTRETPDETDPLRKFYCSLHEQRPESAMAKKWKCQHGLLPQDEAEQYLAENGKVKSPVKTKTAATTGTPKRKSVSTTKGGASASAKKRPAKRKAKDDSEEEADDESSDEDDDFVVSKKPKLQPKASRQSGSKQNVKRQPAVKRQAVKRDVAFDDGGLDDSSDDDKPLAFRM